MGKKGGTSKKKNKSKKSKPIEHILSWDSEPWEDSELVHLCTGFNLYTSDYEKIVAAAAHCFRDAAWSASWKPQSGAKYIWEKFQHYLGVPVYGNAIAERKLDDFFNNPEKSIKIFMSSYSRYQGYILSEENFDYIARVPHCFVRFLLRSRILPQIEHELYRSLEIFALAINELPKTLKVGKTFPDKFSRACNACWGKKADGYEPTTSLEQVDDNTLEEPKAKRQKCTSENRPADLWATGSTSTSTSVCDWAAIAAAEGWGQNVEVTDETSGWASLEVDEPESLFSLLGPTGTALPLTHSPGIVERSMRQILSITRPPSSVAKSLPSPKGIYKPDADAVELELDRRFAKVVLAPMIDWDGGEAPVYSKPIILATSQGAVVGQDNHHTPTSPTNPQPHNPESDEITLLVDDIASDYLCEGMGIAGTWVQLVRQGDPAVDTKKGKSKKSTYWYLDEFALNISSFWTICDN